MHMLIPVILAGGSGTRLWPLSRNECPKQFLNLCGDKTLFQQTLERIRTLPHIGAPIIVCNQGHKHLVLEQLQAIGITDAQLILEPCGRNTAPAAALAALSALKVHADATLLILPSDHVIAEEAKLHQAIDTARQCAANNYLTCFGITPTHPETGYGYIKKGPNLKDNLAGGFCIERFVEKPSLDVAKEYLQSKQYFWNSGMFMFRAAQYLQELKKFALDIFASAQDVAEHSLTQDNITLLPEELFAACPSKSIDYAVMEHTKHAAVIMLDAGWSDLGSWHALWEASAKDENNNVLLGDIFTDDTKQSYIHATTKRRIVTLGIKDCIIVETQDAILIADKAHCAKISNILPNVNDIQKSRN
jgi:mannose-1-phosphate guanylyltransferase/mannose-6-phosphate isomerase